ncbi:glycosyltransferase family 4 protein [Tropicimonas isoalkanivorans]|uniref:Glycosyltransferase involved in cell wall bisynthesis n=1 Tax=Tropicimonas isoalkanivorans TaxID=441112 RepID=A0A1I1DRZ2_9RHOB|nr:glycosyltransferase family 4 protein [Tropicimonas isoalkanivorans]SFB77661.1 Glycosyltransferase involved in cell wall bisynthesis [Tropicimonas isoalkanivorans]
MSNAPMNVAPNSLMRSVNEISQEHTRNAKALRYRIWPRVIPRSRKVLGVFPYPLKNPFLPLLYSNFQAEVVALPSLRRGLRLARHGRIDALHIHFEDQVTRRTRFEPRQSLENAAREAVELLTEFISNGGRLVWTLHNAENHYETTFSDAMFELRRYLAQNADVVHVFNEAGARHARDTLDSPRNRIARIAHPSYFGSYGDIPSPTHPADQRRFLCFGTILPFKGIEEFLTTIGQADFDHHCGKIIIAGPHWGHRSPDLSQHVPDNRNVELRYGFVPDEEVSSLFAETDFAVLNYKRVLTSGFAALAMTMGKPIVGADRGGIKEAVPPENHHLLYAPDDPDGLARVIHRACTMPAEEHMALQKACRDFAYRIHPLTQSQRLENVLRDYGIL